MEPRYVKLEYEEALSAKKELLSSQISILNVAKQINKFLEQRKKELLTKSKIKSLSKEMINTIEVMESSFPEGSNKIKIKRIDKEPKKFKNIEEELKEIKAKLAELG